MPGDFQITAFCAASARLKADTLAAYPAATFDTDRALFLVRPAFDAVLVLTPIQLNAATAVAALRASKDVFIEKPIAHSAAAGQALLAAAHETGRRVWVLEQAVYHPRWALVRQALADPALGGLVYFNQVIHWPIDAGANDRGGYGQTAWRQQPAYPLGPFFDGGAHQVAVLSTLFGAPRWVFAGGSRLRPDFGDYDHLVLHLGNSPQFKGIVSHSSILGEQRNSFTLWGTAGSLAIEDAQLVLEPYAGDRRVIPAPAADAHDQMWRALAASVASGQPPAYTLAQAAGDLAVLLAVDQSIMTGEKVNLPAAG